MATKKYTRKHFNGNKMQVDMSNIHNMLIRWLNNYFSISATEEKELEISSGLAMERAVLNFQHSGNKYYRGGK